MQHTKGDVPAHRCNILSLISRYLDRLFDLFDRRRERSEKVHGARVCVCEEWKREREREKEIYHFRCVIGVETESSVCKHGQTTPDNRSRSCLNGYNLASVLRAARVYLDGGIGSGGAPIGVGVGVVHVVSIFIFVMHLS